MCPVLFRYRVPYCLFAFAVELSTYTLASVSVIQPHDQFRISNSIARQNGIKKDRVKRPSTRGLVTAWTYSDKIEKCATFLLD